MSLLLVYSLEHARNPNFFGSRIPTEYQKYMLRKRFKNRNQHLMTINRYIV